MAAMLEGRDGLRTIRRFDTSAFVSSWGGIWPAWDDRVQAPLSGGSSLLNGSLPFPADEMALCAAQEALSQASLEKLDSLRVALVLGTCFGQGFTRFHELTESLAEKLGLRGPRVTLSTACSSSTNAIGMARDLLVDGSVDIVLAGGVDVLLQESFAGFNAIAAMSVAKCAPFGEPYGMNLAEGAGFVVLERSSDAADRGVCVLGSIDGYGLSSDAHHETSPDPTGVGVERAIKAALIDAGISESHIDYVNAHATGTESNDRIEWEAIERSLGQRSKPVPTNGLKSFLGHTMGSAGVLELILGLLCMNEGMLPPTLRAHPSRPGAPGDPLDGKNPRKQDTRSALKLSSGFGGANAVLVHRSAPAFLCDTKEDSTSGLHASSVALPALVELQGCAVVGGAAVDAISLCSYIDNELPVSQTSGSINLAAVAPMVDPRRLDRASLALTKAVATGILDAGIGMSFDELDRVGLFLGATRMSVDSTTRCQASLNRFGPAGMSAVAFSRMSVNASAGACSKSLGLRGPTSTLSIGAGSDLLAIVYAARSLSRRTDTCQIVAAGLEESPEDAQASVEGFSAVLRRLTNAPCSGAILVAGWGIAGPGDLQTAAAAALNDGILPDSVWADVPHAKNALGKSMPDASNLRCGFRNLQKVFPLARNATVTLALPAAVYKLRTKAMRSLLLLSGKGQSAAVAIVLRMV